MQRLQRAGRAIEGKLRAYVLLNMATQKESESSPALIYSAAAGGAITVAAFSPAPLVTPETQARTVTLQHLCNTVIERGSAKSKKYAVRAVEFLGRVH